MNPASLVIQRIDALDDITETDAIIALLDHKGARGELSYVDWPEVSSSRPMASFATAYSKEYLYIDFLVRCNYLRAENTANQSPVSEDSCVEFFVEPVPGGEYWNFEFNCIGAINASHRMVRPQPTRLDADQLASIRRYASCGTRPFRELEGLFTWNLLVAIPLSLMGLDADNMPEKVRGNFYKCASATSEPHYLSWNPILTDKPDFHRPDFFGDIYFARP